MSNITKAARVTTVLQIIQRMNDGMTVTAACREAGMPRSTFYAIIQREADAVSEIQNLVLANTRDNLIKGLAYRTAILERIIEAGLSDGIKVRDRLAIYKALIDISEKLIEEFESNKQGGMVRAIDFSGPALRKTTSRLVAKFSKDITT